MATEPDWNYVKQKTLLQYEELIEKIKVVLAYSFVQEFYNHSMTEAANYSVQLQKHYLINGKRADYISDVSKSFRALGDIGIKNYNELILSIETKEKCRTFLEENKFSFKALIQLLNFLFRWILPFPGPVKELINPDEKESITALEILRKNHKIKSSLDVLENLRTQISRSKTAKETGISESFINNLVNNADLSRLAYVRGKTIKYLSGGGYNTLKKLAGADLKTMEADMNTYFISMGRKFSQFKNVIPLDWMIGGAKVLPKIIE